MKLSISSDAVSSAGRTVQDLALAALVGGNLFGRVAMHPALADVGDRAERGKVLNRAWRRYGMVNSVALATLVAGWLPSRLNTKCWTWSTSRERLPSMAEDVAMGAIVISGLASAATGVGFSQQAPEGAVPMNSGHDTAPEASPRAAKLKRVVNALGAIHLAAGVALLAVRSAPTKAHIRRPLLRQPLRRPR